jgi:hypothetical protein
MIEPTSVSASMTTKPGPNTAKNGKRFTHLRRLGRSTVVALLVVKDMGAWFRSAKFNVVDVDTGWQPIHAPDRPFGRDRQPTAPFGTTLYLQLIIILNCRSRVNRTNLVLSNASPHNPFTLHCISAVPAGPAGRNSGLTHFSRR